MTHQFKFFSLRFLSRQNVENKFVLRNKIFFRNFNPIRRLRVARKPVLNSYFIMHRVSLWNLLVCDAFKVVPLELAMSSFFICLFWVVLLECTTSRNIALGSKDLVQWRDKTCVPPCYK